MTTLNTPSIQHQLLSKFSRTWTRHSIHIFQSPIRKSSTRRERVWMNKILLTDRYTRDTLKEIQLTSRQLQITSKVRKWLTPLATPRLLSQTTRLILKHRRPFLASFTPIQVSKTTCFYRIKEICLKMSTILEIGQPLPSRRFSRSTIAALMIRASSAGLKTVSFLGPTGPQIGNWKTNSPRWGLYRPQTIKTSIGEISQSTRKMLRGMVKEGHLIKTNS